MLVKYALVIDDAVKNVVLGRPGQGPDGYELVSGRVSRGWVRDGDGFVKPPRTAPSPRASVPVQQFIDAFTDAEVADLLESDAPQARRVKEKAQFFASIGREIKRTELQQVLTVLANLGIITEARGLEIYQGLNGG